MSNALELMDLLFPGTRQRVLAVLLLQPEASFHLRELARLAKAHAGTLGRELDKLTRSGLLVRTEQGNQVRYQAHSQHPLFPELSAMFRKTHGIVPALREALCPLGSRVDLALVFGSVARGTATAGSDVDLLVLGKAGFAELAKAVFPLHEQFHREVNPSVYTLADFTARWRRGDTFARDVMAKPHLWVKGGDDDFAEFAGDPAPAGP